MVCNHVLLDIYIYMHDDMYVRIYIYLELTPLMTLVLIGGWVKPFGGFNLQTGSSSTRWTPSPVINGVK